MKKCKKENDQTIIQKFRSHDGTTKKSPMTRKGGVLSVVVETVTMSQFSV